MAGIWNAFRRLFGGPSSPPLAASTLHSGVPTPTATCPPQHSAAVAPAIPAPTSTASGLHLQLKPGETYVMPDDVSDQERAIVEDFLRSREILQRLLDTGFKSVPKEQAYANALEVKRLLQHFKEITEQHPGLTLRDATEVTDLMENMEVWSQPLHCKQHEDSVLVAILDTETTGLEEEDQPISIAAVLLEVSATTGDVFAEVDSYYGLREPTVPINPRAQSVHGLTFEHVRGQRWDLKRLYKIVNSAALLVAHNAQFDRRMLAQLMPHVLERKWACTMYSLKHDWTRLSDGKWALDTICRSLDIPRSQQHGAMEDCRALQQVLTRRAGKTKRSKTLMRKLLDKPLAPPP